VLRLFWRFSVEIFDGVAAPCACGTWGVQVVDWGCNTVDMSCRDGYIVADFTHILQHSGWGYQPA